MSNWITAPLQLKGNVVELFSLEESHIPELVALAKEKSIWEFYAIDGSNEVKLKNSLYQSLIDCANRTEFPFIIYHREHKKIIGSTRYLDINSAHRKLEIGWTWMHPDYWGLKVNAECKLLLLAYAFETMKAVRVQLKTDENNLRSRRAIEKVGAKQEGILRNDMIRDNGTFRNSVYFSIISKDWIEVKQRLKTRLEEI